MKKLRGVREVFQDLKSKIKYEDAPEESTFSFMDKLFFKEVFSSIKNVIVLLIGVLVSSCQMASGATPFGLAILGATSLINVPLIIPFLAISVITGLLLGKVALLKFIIAGILYVAIKAFIKTENTKMGNAGIIIFACMMSEIVGLSIEGMLLYNALFAVYNSVMTGVFFLIFSEGLPVIYSFDKERVNSSEALMCAGIILAVVVSSFGNLGIAGITFRGVISILAVMLLGWKCGAAVGATSGLSISLVLGIMGHASVATVATYAFCGMLSGILAKYGKIGAVIGFVLGNIVLVFFANGSTEVLISIKEIIVASAVLFLIPKKLLVVIDNLFDYNRVLPGEGVVRTN